MGHITVSSENTREVELYFEDHGHRHAPPVVLIHGYLLDGHSWEQQTQALLEAGYRVISYDRRGFGRSGRLAGGHGYDTFAADLDMIIDALGLRDVVLVGFSMGIGEIARYLARYGSENIKKVVLLAPMEPFFPKSTDNLTGVAPYRFDAAATPASKDRYAYFTRFFADLYDHGTSGERSCDDRAHNPPVSASSSWHSSVVPAASWRDEFRADVASIDVPTLIVQGTDDQILPIAASRRAFAEALPSAAFVEIEGAPHGLLTTHADEVNEELVQFLADQP